jgi:adenylate kinase family enzyme
MGRKIAVVGVSGNGKTTFARAVAVKLDLPYTELDALNHKPGWSRRRMTSCGATSRR